MRLLYTLLFVVAVGCTKTELTDCRDVVAVDAAMATLIESTPSPDKCSRCGGKGVIVHGDGHKTPCPDCTDGAVGRTGPLDTIRQVKELVAKGNTLADRGKTILDAAESQGYVELKIQIPKKTMMMQSSPQSLRACLANEEGTAGERVCASCPLQPPQTNWTPPYLNDETKPVVDSEDTNTRRQGWVGEMRSKWYLGKRLGRGR